MMPLTTLLLQQTDRTALVDYLKSIGFQEERRSQAWVLLQGMIGELGDFEFSVPAPGNNSGQGDQSAVDVLDAIAEVHNEPRDFTRFRITGHHRDLYTYRVGDGDHIPLDLAAKLPFSLKHLLGAACAAETQGPRPFFQGGGHLNASLLKKYDFCHTLRGSYALAVRSPRLERTERIELAKRQQVSLFPDAEEHIPEVQTPLTRRVSERVEQSLNLVESISMRDDKSVLSTSYAESLNANMSTALAHMLAEAGDAITFRTIWAPSLPPPASAPSNTVRGILPDAIQTIRATSREALIEAAEVLRKIEPEVVEIPIVIKGFLSDSPPLLSSASRVLYAGWIQGDKTKQVIIHIDDPSHYQLAQQSHTAWDVLTVRGEIHQGRGALRMTNVEWMR